MRKVIIVLFVLHLIAISNCQEKYHKLSYDDLYKVFSDQNNIDPSGIQVVDSDGKVLSQDEIEKSIGDTLFGFDYFVNSSGEIVKAIRRAANRNDIILHKRLIESRFPKDMSITYIKVDCTQLPTLLSEAFNKDQNYRRGKLDKSPDLDNLTIVVNILEQCGGLNDGRYTEEDIETIWLIIQHSNHKFRERYFPILKDAERNGLISSANMATMEDRILLGRGEKQLYGTQVRSVDGGAYCLLPVQFPERLERMRDSVGLTSIHEYLLRWGLAFNLKEHTTE